MEELTAKDYFKKGLKKFDNSKFKKAVLNFTKAIELDSEKPKYYVKRAEAFMFMGNTEESVIDSSEAIELDPDYDYAYYIRGKANFLSENFEEAIIDLTLAVKMDPELDVAFLIYELIGESKFNLGFFDYDAIVEDYNKSIELTYSEHDTPFVLRGNLKQKHEDYEGAIDDYTIAIDLEPDEAEYYKLRGVAKEKFGDIKGAITDWEKATLHGDEEAPEWLVKYYK